MTIPEKVSYIKGLAEGLQLGESKEEKLLKEIIGVLEDIALAIDDIDTTCAEIGEQVDAVDEDLAAVEDFLLDEEDYYDDECDCCECDCDNECYEIECPQCGDTLYIDEEMIEEGGIQCPNCKTNLEFDFECDCDECAEDEE